LIRGTALDLPQEPEQARGAVKKRRIETAPI